MPTNRITDGASNTVDLMQNPLRESSQSGEASQPTGLDSSGTMYVYDKARLIRDSFKLIFPRLTLTVLNQLLSFQANLTHGSQYPFAWFDHEGTVHTVRLVDELRYREITPGAYRVELSLEEETPWTPALDTSLLTTYAAPLWILKMTINSVAWYLADSTLYIPIWGITTKPWISSWGSIQSGISGALGEFQTSDLAVSILIDPAANPNMETLATVYPLEGDAAELYLYDCSGAAAPILKFTGFVGDVDIPDETIVNLTIEDESTRLKTYIGRKLTLTDYPGADPDDVGKVIPIVTGFVRKVPALCLVSGWVTSLTGAITAAATTLTVAEVPNLYLVGKVLQIDDEKLTITAASGITLTVTRGTGLTLATDHADRSVVMEDITTPLVYIVADHPVDTVGMIFARIRGVDVDITGYCTTYNGQGGANDYSGYPGKTIVTIADIVAVRNYVNLIVTEAGHSHNSAVSSSENTTLSLPTATVYTAGYAKPSGYPYQPGASMYKSVTFPASGGTRSSCSYSITFTPTQTHNADVLVVINGVCKWWSNMNLYSGSPFTVTFTANVGAEANANSFDIVTVGAGLGSLINVTASTRLVYLSSTPSTSSMSGANLTGNSVSDTVIGEGLLVNIHNIKSIEQVFGNILTLAGMANTAVAIWGGILATGYSTGTEMLLNPGFTSGANWTLAGLLLGTEVILNGNFAAGAANWAANTGTTITTGGAACNTALNSWAFQQAALTFEFGATYRVVFTISNYSGTGRVLALIGQSGYTYRSGNGTYTMDVVPLAGSQLVFWTDTAVFTGTISAVSVKKVQPAPSISGGVLTIDTGSAVSGLCSQSVTLASGSRYRLSYTLARSAGQALASLSAYANSADVARAVSGVYNYDFTATGSGSVTLRIDCPAVGYVGTIDNVSLKPLTWTAGIFDTNRYAITYDFKTTAGLIGFCTASAATLTQSVGGNGLVITATGGEPNTMLALPALQYGPDTIRVKFKRLSGSGTFDGYIYWVTTTRTTYDGSHYQIIPQPADLASWNTVDLDVASGPGGSEWAAATVNAIRLDFSNTSGDVYAVEFIEIIRTDGATLNGVINEYLPADVWLNRLAFQLRSWFKYLAGVPTLIVRPDSLTPTVTLDACKITADGRKVHSRKKTPREDVLNMINVHFERDWFKTGDGAYRQVLTGSDATSIGIYGEMERPELFRFDFITSPGNARILLNFYLGYHKDRHWQHQFEVFLDQHGLDFADVITMGFAGSKIGQITNVGFNPGDSSTIDTIKVTAEVD